MVLDLMLPGLDGVSVCRTLRVPPPAGAQILDASGRVMHHEGPPGSALIDQRTLARALAGATLVETRGRRRLVAAPAQRHGRRQVLVAAASLRAVGDASHRVLELLLLGGAGALALVAAGGWWIARRALRPIERMTTRAETIGIDDLSQRIAVPRVDDELAHLARTLNAVGLSRLVDNLLTLARVDEDRLELLIAPHDLGDLADRTVRGQRAAAARRGVAIEVTGDEVVGLVAGDRLAQVLTNLLDNAVRHSPAGGRVRRAIGARDGETHIAVSDDGPGIPSGEREHAFERFSRRDPARSGGAVCREIVRAHHGQIWIDDRPPPGTTVRVVLPANCRPAR